MIGVKCKQNEPIEYLINRFNSMCNNAGLLSELKEYRHYEKPSDLRHRTMQSLKRKKFLKDIPIKTKLRKPRKKFAPIS